MRGEGAAGSSDSSEASATVRVVNPQGLHARPISCFVKLSSRYSCRISVRGPGGEADGASVLSMMSLAASQGAELAITARGADAHEALAALVDLVTRGFDEA
ncbi:MAG: hypothetical protein DHS20C15_22380 [Planctomycetota bacterium]|nr:MAG: hypothetical protein DHS20C15_22380 [Planctomycetota bacterium]